MKILGFLSLLSYFVAFGFVVVAEEICPGASESTATMLVFFFFILLGAALAYLQNDERFDYYVFLKKEKMTDEDYEELIKMIEERKKELSS